MQLDVYICRSPLQLLNCIEAHNKFKSGNKSLLFAAHSVPQDESLMKKLLELYPSWDEVVFFPLYPIFNQIAAVRRFFRRKTQVEKLFIGDSTKFINFVINNHMKPKLCIMVDDGASTLSRAPLIAERTLHLRKKNLAPQSRIISKFQESVGLAATYLYNARFFTLYDLAKFNLQDRTDPNELEYCRSKLQQKPLNQETWFIGSNFRGDLLKNPESYEKLISNLSQLEDLTRVVYIPHRKEPDDYLAMLASQHGFTVRRFTTIIELEILNSTHLPERIISFGSSAVNTLNQLIHRPTTIYQVPQALLAEHRSKVAIELYDVCKSNGYTMIELELESAKPSAGTEC